MDRSEWLSALSFERSHEVLSAINTLSIHAKLGLAQVDDARREGSVQQARKDLLAFLDRFQVAIKGKEEEVDLGALGVDPRMGQLVEQYVTTKSRWPRPTGGLYQSPLEDFRILLASDKLEDQTKIIDCLRELRHLIEEHSRADNSVILGDI